jgi:putative RNA 2'-phosphotransferase
MTKSLTEKSKYLSFLLRHKPEAAKLKLDKEGWCALAQLISNTDLTLDEIHEIVRTDSKGRYTIDGDKIRANQGHSTGEVKLTFKSAVPPVALYHGTTRKVWEDIIRTEGLKPMSRHHVHMSADITTALIVSNRRKAENIILKVDAKRMLADGFKFFISENSVWLVDAVPAKYLAEDLE